MDTDEEVNKMGKLTKKQIVTLRKGHCCDCEGQLLAGPRGGLCQNVECELCGHKFNLGPVTADRI